MRTESAVLAAAKAGDHLSVRAAEGMLGPNPFVGFSRKQFLAASATLAAGALKAPLTLLEHEAAAVHDLIRVVAGKSDIAPDPADRRFADETWQSNVFFKRCLQGYLTLTRSFNLLVDDLGLHGREGERARFLAALITEACAPTNLLLTNPAAVKRLVATRGRSVVDGLKNLATDLRHNGGMPAQVDRRAFAVGKNLAASPGAVVFRNDVLELIQYRPTTRQVHARPLLLVPPQINKFYVYDLARGRSLVEYLVGNGLQVFAVSWRNPTRDHAHWGLSEYVGALVQALAAIKQISGSRDVNVQGACSGAMTVTALLGYLAAKKDRSVKSATQMVAVLDHSDESQLGVFASARAIALAKANSARRGVLEGREMSRVFAWLRPNDLVWNYWVNNYLLGKKPPAFDLLYWNNDTTRLPAKFHAEILDALDGRLFAQPGAIEVLGTPIELARIRIDRYAVAGLADHITPWRSCYRSARLPGGKLTMVVSSSGHIQSLVNPPGNPKAKYFLNEQSPEDPDAWLKSATPMADSWWGHWRDWLRARSGPRQPAPARLGSAKHRPVAPAPGAYVFE